MLFPAQEYQIIRLYAENSTIIPIPLHRTRLKERGFNQAELFAQILARRWNIPLKNSVLDRVIQTQPQALLPNRTQRHTQMNAVFTAKQRPSLDILLVDDVFTTGATLNDAARALKQAGAKKVFGVTIAR